MNQGNSILPGGYDDPDPEKSVYTPSKLIFLTIKLIFVIFLNFIDLFSRIKSIVKWELYLLMKG